MHFKNLILNLHITNTVKSTLSAKSSPLTISQARPTIEYCKQDLIALKHKHVNLTGLPNRTISTIRRLNLNRIKIRKAKPQEKLHKQESSFATYTRFPQ